MSIRRTRFSRLAAAILLMAPLALAPLVAGSGAADARPGGGYSMGSRGSRTYSAPSSTATAPYSASPMNRSATGRPSPYGSGASFGPGRSLATGLLGGFLGASLAGMIFGHGYGYGAGGGFGMLGFLIKLALIFFILRWLYRRFFGPAARTLPAGPGTVGVGYGQANARVSAAPIGSVGSGWGGAGAPRLAITQADYAQFEQNLKNVQAAWTRSDFGGLQQLATPEMVAYFGEQLQDLSRRGAHNAVSDVRLQKGDLSEAWSEHGLDYATVAMRYSIIDVTTDASGRVVDGSPTERVIITELWTFVRRSGTGSWVLSAIQQAR